MSNEINTDEVSTLTEEAPEVCAEVAVLPAVGKTNGVVPKEDQAEIARETGMVPVSNSVLRQIEELGIRFEGIGQTREVQGFTLFTQVRLAHCMDTISMELEKGGAKFALSAAPALASLARAMAQCNHAVKPMAHAEPAQAPRRSFAPYAAVQVNVQGGDKVEIKTQSTESKP